MQEKRLNSKNIITMIGIILAVILIVIGILLNINSNKLDNPSDKSINQTDNTINTNILKKLNIDKYLGIILNAEITLNENLLDDNYVFFHNYIYSNEDLYKVKIQFGEDPNNTHIYCRYSDYINFYTELLGKKKAQELSLRDIYLPDLKEISQNLFYASLENLNACEDIEDMNCYVPLTTDWKEVSTIEFKELNNKNNIITGIVRRITQIDSSNYYLDAMFEFEYTKENSNYYAVALKITSVKEAYQEIINNIE